MRVFSSLHNYLHSYLMADMFCKCHQFLAFLTEYVVCVIWKRRWSFFKACSIGEEGPFVDSDVTKTTATWRDQPARGWPLCLFYCNAIFFSCFNNKLFISDTFTKQEMKVSVINFLTFSSAYFSNKLKVVPYWSNWSNVVTRSQNKVT